MISEQVLTVTEQKQQQKQPVSRSANKNLDF